MYCKADNSCSPPYTLGVFEIDLTEAAASLSMTAQVSVNYFMDTSVWTKATSTGSTQYCAPNGTSGVTMCWSDPPRERSLAEVIAEWGQANVPGVPGCPKAHGHRLVRPLLKPNHH
eukprot:6109595-Pyramimonas_sp.AAC.1